MAITDRKGGTASATTLSDRKDGVTTGLAMKRPCRVVSVSNITLAGLQTIDGVTLTADDRVLVTGQTTGANNGIYAASSGNWSRAKDFDGSLDVVCGTMVLVTAGTLYPVTFWRVSTADDITIGTTSLTFTQISPPLTDFIQSGTGAVSRTYLAKAQEIYSVLDFIPVAEHAAIRAYSSTTDLATYLNAAIAAVASRKGILLWPTGLYPTSTALGQTSLRNVIFQGEGGLDLTYAGTSGTVIKFTGTGSGNIITMTDHRGVWWRDIQITFTSNSFTGKVFNASSSFSTGNASGFENVQIYQLTNSGHNATIGFYLKNNVDVTWRNCYVSHVVKAWVGLLSTDVGAETNMIRLEKCTTIACKTAAIHNPVNGWHIDQHNFEPSDTNAPCGITTDGAFDIIDLTILNCKCADSTANGTWYKFDNNTFNLRIVYGAILALSATVTGVLFNGTFHGQPQITGVYISGLTTGINFNSGAASVAGASVQNVQFLSTTTPIANMASCDTSSIFLANTPDTGNRALKAGYGGTDQQGGYTAGDILYASGASTLVKLAVGAANTLLKGGVLPAYAALLPADVASLLPLYIGGSASGIAFDSVADTAITITLPAGKTRWRLSSLNVYGANGDLSAASFALYAAAGGAGTAIRAITACNVTTASDNTAGNLEAVGVSVDAAYTLTTVYFRITTAGAAGRTGKVYIVIQPMP